MGRKAGGVCCSSWSRKKARGFWLSMRVSKEIFEALMIAQSALGLEFDKHGQPTKRLLKAQNQSPKPKRLFQHRTQKATRMAVFLLCNHFWAACGDNLPATFAAFRS